MKNLESSTTGRSVTAKPCWLAGVVALMIVCMNFGAAGAQSVSPAEVAANDAFAAKVLLPGAPNPLPNLGRSNGDSLLLPQSGSAAPVVTRRHRTGVYDHLIDPEEIAPKLTAGDKFGMGLKSAVSPFAVMGWVGAATYSEAFNRSPNYGQSGKDYAQRLGAAAAKASSEGIFSTSIMAPLLHEDPRFYVEGPGTPTLHRAFYALTRVFITKTDSGGSSVNYALLSGNAIGAGLTQTYYPAGNRNFRETASTFGVSLAGSGVKYLFEEFFYKEASMAQLKRRIEER